ncbi:MAG: hypothetical protein MUE40_21365, partial [Anaerolineae bacterium]|nr:hypothetical protein [Anaerolineae bacterium]
VYQALVAAGMIPGDAPNTAAPNPAAPPVASRYVQRTPEPDEAAPARNDVDVYQALVAAGMIPGDAPNTAAPNPAAPPVASRYVQRTPEPDEAAPARNDVDVYQALVAAGMIPGDAPNPAAPPVQRTPAGGSASPRPPNALESKLMGWLGLSPDTPIAGKPLQRTPAATPPAPARSPESTGPAVGPATAPAAPPADSPRINRVVEIGEVTSTVNGSGTETTDPDTDPTGPDEGHQMLIEEVAQKVYQLLRQRLWTEKERFGKF